MRQLKKRPHLRSLDLEHDLIARDEVPLDRRVSINLNNRLHLKTKKRKIVRIVSRSSISPETLIPVRLATIKMYMS